MPGALRMLPLLLVSAAFSECGDSAIDVIVDVPALATVSPVAGSDSIDCRFALTARTSASGDGEAVEWTSLYVTAARPGVASPVVATQHEAASTAALFGGARMQRGETRTGELVVRAPAPVYVHLNLGYQVLPSEGLFLDGHGSVHATVRCGVSG
jgi:hypothetical protein